MAAGTTPIFVADAQAWHVRISTANTARNGSGTLGDLVAGATDASRVDRIVIVATGVTTAGMIRFFLDDGADIRALHEIPVTAVTPDADTEAFAFEWVRSDQDDQALVEVPNGWTLKVGTHNGEEFDVTAFGGDY